MDRYLTFTKQAQEIIDESYDLAGKIWGDCGFDKVRVLAGNFAGYGKYIAHYKPESQIIELPLNYSFPLVHVTAEGIDVKRPERLQGTMLHELGHHVEYHHPNTPWSGLKAGHSTHSSPSWCWVCATGWKYFYPDSAVTPELLAFGVRKDLGGYEYFHPNEDPGRIMERILAVGTMTERLCSYCQEPFKIERDTARFCSDKCRVYSHRAKLRESAA